MAAKREQILRQVQIDGYIQYRLAQGKSRYTVNKDISNLRAFIRWGADQKRRYFDLNAFEFHKLKVEKRLWHCPDNEVIRGLFARCPSPAWRVRLLLHLTTGLRKYDVDNLTVAAIDLNRSTLSVRAKKTGKGLSGHPLPQTALPVVAGYVVALPDGQVRLFTDGNLRKTWTKISDKTGLTRHDLRRVFSTYMQKIGSFGSAKTLLGHSDDRLTQDFYTDEEMILRWKVEQLPVLEWIK